MKLKAIVEVSWESDPAEHNVATLDEAALQVKKELDNNEIDAYDIIERESNTYERYQPSQTHYC